MPRFTCPGCNNVFEVLSEHVGRVVRCPTCGEPLATSLGGRGAPAGPPGPGPTLLGESTGGAAGAPPAVPAGAPVAPPAPVGPQTAPSAPSVPRAAPQTAEPSAPYPSYALGALGPQPTLSRAGVVSFALGLLYWLGSCVVGIVAYAPLLERVGRLDPAQVRAFQKSLLTDPPAWLSAAGLLLLGSLLLGLVLGLYGATRPNTRKGFPIAGVVLCGLGLCCSVLTKLMTMAVLG